MAETDITHGANSTSNESGNVSGGRARRAADPSKHAGGDAPGRFDWGGSYAAAFTDCDSYPVYRKLYRDDTVVGAFRRQS